jgi:predicted amidohydrolase YtcJ
MAAAVNRPAGFEQEAISPETALALYTKPADNAGAEPRKIAVGEPADLCLLTKPWAEVRGELEGAVVKATWIRGELVYDRVDQAPV